MKASSVIFRKDVISWSLYDFANTIYSMNILSLYFKRWVVMDLGHDGIAYDISYSLSMLLAAVLMPALGALSDHSQKKRLLFLFTISCCLSIVGIRVFGFGLFPAYEEYWFLYIMILFALSNFFYEGGMVFYNSLLYSVSDGLQARFVSGFGVALGYLGAIAGMILVIPFVTGRLFDIPISGFTAGGRAAAFEPTAILFFLFSLPLFLWVRERPGDKLLTKINFRKAYAEVWEGIRNTRKYPGVLRFLIADYFVEDAVATVILNMGIFSSVVLELSDTALTIFFVVSTISAMIGALAIGRMARRLSLKKMLMGIIAGWILVLALFIFIQKGFLIYVLGSSIGILLGGLWTVARPMLAEMIPREELGRFFGLYSLSGRAAAIIGPVIWGVIVYLFNPSHRLGKMTVSFLALDSAAAEKMPYRLAIISLVILMAAGLIIFRKVPER